MTNSDAFATLLEPGAFSLIAGLTALIMLITYATNHITLRRVIGGSLRAIGAGVFITLVETQVHASAGTTVGLIDVIGILAGVAAVTMGYWLAYTVHLIEGSRKGWHLRLLQRQARAVMLWAEQAAKDNAPGWRGAIQSDEELRGKLQKYIETSGSKADGKAGAAVVTTQEINDGTVRLD